MMMVNSHQENMKTLVLVLFVLATFANAQSPDSTLRLIADTMNDLVHHRNGGAFRALFKNPDDSNIIVALGGGRLFNSPLARKNFRAVALKGGDIIYLGSDIQIVGRLRISIYNVKNGATNNYDFKVALEKIPNRDPVFNLWRIAGIIQIKSDPSVKPLPFESRKSIINNDNISRTWPFYIY